MNVPQSDMIPVPPLCPLPPQLLPIDTSREDIKTQLKRSQLAARVMFLCRCSEETTANRKLATELVQIWSRPIFYDADQEAEKRR